VTNGEKAVALLQSITDDDLDAGARLFATDAEWVELPLGLVYRAPDGWHENVNYWRTGFDGGGVEVTKVVDGGDVVVLEYEGRGVNTGRLVTPQGVIEPNGELVVADFVDVWEFRDGMIVKGRSYVGGLLAQLAKPVPESATG
jgi:ketosteroid isomerase-like protein